MLCSFCIKMIEAVVIVWLDLFLQESPGFDTWPGSGHFCVRVLALSV